MPLEVPLTLSLGGPQRGHLRGIAPAASLLLVALLGSLSVAADREAPPRPAFATLEAGLGNWDAEAGLDGWLATIRLFDAAGQPLSFSGNAVFELTPRVPAADLTSFLALPDQRLRWTALVATDERGCATFKLPLRRSSAQTGGRQISGPRTGSSGGGYVSGGHPPLSGLLHVRVVIASEGVYDAESIVTLRPLTPLDNLWPGGLVDTLWHGR